jgi:2-polyprenyl-6-methoxyphenol hydroxylase-like FAD-dependent oxidoreductase
VECAPDTWHATGLAAMSDAESRRYCENIFSEFLEGYSLISNQSYWFVPKIIKNNHWVSGHTTLIGDALKTMHPSIGSGTRAALQDAMALAKACLENPQDVNSALMQFEEKNKFNAEKSQNAALRSIDWYESIHERLHFSPLKFAYDYMMRTGKINHDRMRNMDPGFVRAYELHCCENS